jgi:hypothetical protein
MSSCDWSGLIPNWTPKKDTWHLWQQAWNHALVASAIALMGRPALWVVSFWGAMLVMLIAAASALTKLV